MNKINNLIQNLNIDIKSLDNVECSECSNIIFISGHIIKKVSALLTETGKPGFLPIPTFACSKCGNINKELDSLNQYL